MKRAANKGNNIVDAPGAEMTSGTYPAGVTSGLCKQSGLCLSTEKDMGLLPMKLIW